MVKLDSLDIRGVRDGDYVDAGPGVYTTALPRPAHSTQHGDVIIASGALSADWGTATTTTTAARAINVNIRL